MKCRSCSASCESRYGCYDRFTCEKCTNQEKIKKDTECKRKVDEITAKFELYKSKLKFLCLQFDNEPADEIRKGDVVLVVQGKSDEALHAHKFILMLEGKTGVVHIDDATLPVMQAVIKFCYSAAITFTEEVTGEDVLVVAHKYEITLLHKICEDHLIATLDNDNLGKRLRLAKRFDAPLLETATTGYFKTNFDSVISAVLTELW